MKKLAMGCGILAMLGMPMMDLDIAGMIEDVRNGRQPTQPDRTLPVGPTGPPATRKLVSTHHKELEDNAPLAFFGL